MALRLPYICQIVLLLVLNVHARAQAKPGTGMRVKDHDAPLRAGCDPDAPLVATLAAGAPLKLRYVLMGETPCYKVAADMEGRQIEGYLPAAAIEGLDTFDKGRRDAAWITTTEALSAARNAQALSALKAPY